MKLHHGDGCTTVNMLKIFEFNIKWINVMVYKLYIKKDFFKDKNIDSN